MRKKKHTSSTHHGSNGFEHLAADADFYTGSPTERPLYQDRPVSDMSRVRKTGRHQSVAGRRKETADPREKAALLAILKSVIMILLLLIAFFMLWKGIKIYEESVVMDNQTAPEVSPVMREIALAEDFDIAEDGTRQLFAERIGVWKETDRLIGTVDALLVRNNYDQALAKCQDVLKLNPAHMGALERLGRLYYGKGMYVEAINSYIRLLNVDPSRRDLQKELIKVLDAHGDSKAVIFTAQWYLDRNYDEDVQRFLAYSHFLSEQYGEAASAYDRVLKDSPGDTRSMENQATAYIRLEQYDKALAVLEKLSAINYRDQNCYRQIAICYAQLGHGLETVQTLGKAAHLFGQNTVVGWIQDPRLDPVRQDRTFQAFADRVGGEEFRKWLETVAKTMEGNQEKVIDPQLILPKPEIIQAEELLQPKR